MPGRHLACVQLHINIAHVHYNANLTKCLTCDCGLQLKECTFRPRVNKTSAHMMSDRAEALKALNVTAHDQLFQVCQSSVT
jgi:hypothetical protein